MTLSSSPCTAAGAYCARVMVKMAVLRSCTLPRSIICEASIPHGSWFWHQGTLLCCCMCSLHVSWWHSKYHSHSHGPSVPPSMAQHEP